MLGGDGELKIFIGDVRATQCVKQPVPNGIFQPPHFLLCDNPSLIILSDAVESSDFGLDLRHISCQFLLNLIAAILPAGKAFIQRAAALTVEHMGAASYQKIFLADNAPSDVISGVQGCHIICLQQHLQTVGSMLLADGKLPIRQFPWHIAHHTVVVFLIEGVLQADGIYDQLLYQALVVIKLIERSGIILRRIVFKFGENEVDKVVDGMITV